MKRIGVRRIIACVSLITVLLPARTGPAAARSIDEDFQTWGMVIITGSVAPSSQTPMRAYELWAR